jgi:excisionase family DNA binding protein
LIARQEALRVFRGVVETRAADPGAALLSDLSIRPENRPEAVASEAGPSHESGERFLSVAEVAKRLDVSEKTVRREITRGHFPVHRVGKVIRVSERVLPAYVTGPGSRRD